MCQHHQGVENHVNTVKELSTKTTRTQESNCSRGKGPQGFAAGLDARYFLYPFSLWANRLSFKDLPSINVSHQDFGA